MPVYNSGTFEAAADAFRAQCTVPMLVQLAEENVATQPAPPYVAFLVPETSILSAVAKTLIDSFSRYLAEPQNPPLFWLTRAPGARDPVPWSTPVGLLAQQVLNEDSNSSNNDDDNNHNNNSSISINKFPIKLYANFRATKRSDLFPFYAAHCNGVQLVDGLEISVLHALKRSVAVMNPLTYRDFLGELNPQDMKKLKHFCLMDSMSISARTEFAQFHKNILGTINIVAWPVMIHSLESGRTLTMAVPARFPLLPKAGGDGSSSDEAVQQKQHEHHHPHYVAGIQGAFFQQQTQNSPTHSGGATSVTAAAAAAAESMTQENSRPSVFGDIVSILAHKMDPAHLVKHVADKEKGQQVEDALRRRLLVSGLPEAPLSETPLRWLMEHLVGADLALHVVLLKPQK